MKIAVHLARNRRLLGWCALSLSLHLLALVLVDPSVLPPTPTLDVPSLAVRLARAPAAPDRPAPAPAIPKREPVHRENKPVAAAEAPLAQHLRPLLPGAPAANPAPTEPVLDLVQDPEPLPAAAPASDAGLAAPVFYQVRIPPSVHLRYAVTRTDRAGVTETGAAAQLAWRMENGSYRLRMDGVLGEYESEGGQDDVGIAPRSASERAAAGGTLVTRFNRDAERVEYLSGGATLRLGTQDMASLLMQLAGIGLANSEQFNSAVQVMVAGPAGTQVLRFQAAGQETLATGVGELATLHLEQLVPTGERRIDIWLAPQRDWLPVQLRVTEPDGSAATQVVSGIEAAAAQP